jgi:hypothetical protein
MIEITFTGETLGDVAEQAYAFADTVAASSDTRTAWAGKPGAKTEPETSPAQVDPPVSVDLSRKPEEIKEEALDLLREVYNSGAAGQEAVKALLKEFGVKKAGDVPAERAAELLKAAWAAKVE